MLKLTRREVILANVIIANLFWQCFLLVPDKYEETRGSLRGDGFSITPTGERIVFLKHHYKYDVYSTWDGSRQTITWQRWDICQYDTNGQEIKSCLIKESTNGAAILELEGVTDSLTLMKGVDADTFLLVYNIFTDDTLLKYPHKSIDGTVLLNDLNILNLNVPFCHGPGLRCSTFIYKYDFNTGGVIPLWQDSGIHYLAKGIHRGDKSTFIRLNPLKSLLKLDIQNGTVTPLDSIDPLSYLFAFGDNGLLEYNDGALKIGRYENASYTQDSMYRNINPKIRKCSVDSTGHFLVCERDFLYDDIDLIKLPEFITIANIFNGVDSLISN